MDGGSGVEWLVAECVWTRKLSICWETVPLKSSCKQTCVLMVSLLSTVYLHVYAIINDSSAVQSYMDSRLNLHCNTVALKALPRSAAYCIFLGISAFSRQQQVIRGIVREKQCDDMQQKSSSGFKGLVYPH